MIFRIEQVFSSTVFNNKVYINIYKNSFGLAFFAREKYKYLNDNQQQLKK